jgi:hypothetical protein
MLIKKTNCGGMIFCGGIFWWIFVYRRYTARHTYNFVYRHFYRQFYRQPGLQYY